jgi:hypothetical protein
MSNRLQTLSNSSRIPQRGKYCTETPNPISPSAVKTCEEWTCDNNMKLNASKTKEMRVNFSSSSLSYPPIVINTQTVNIVTHGISNDLKWNLHVNAICKKTSKRLYALRLLKRNALPDSVLAKVYRAYVRPSILKYYYYYYSFI